MSTKKPIKQTYSFIDDTTHEVYRIVNSIISSHYPDLVQIKLAVAWRYGWKPDADGNLRESQARKASAAERQIHDFDVILLVNYEVWNDNDTKLAHKEYIIDDVLSTVRIAVDKDGDEKKDESGKFQIRIAKHDFSCTMAVLRRRGFCTPHNEIAKRIISPLFNESSS